MFLSVTCLREKFLREILPAHLVFLRSIEITSGPPSLHHVKLGIPFEGNQICWVEHLPEKKNFNTRGLMVVIRSAVAQAGDAV
jgi:hypothetical protein